MNSDNLWFFYPLLALSIADFPYCLGGQAWSHSRINFSFGFAETFTCWKTSIFIIDIFWSQVSETWATEQCKLKDFLNSLSISSIVSWAITFARWFSTNCLWQFWHWYWIFCYESCHFLTGVVREWQRGNRSGSWHILRASNPTDFLLDKVPF